MQNLAQALDTPFQFVLESRILLENKGFGVEVNKTDYSDTLINSLISAGVDIENLLRYINMGIENGFEENDKFLPYNTVLYETIPIIKTVLEVFPFPLDAFTSCRHPFTDFSQLKEYRCNA